MSTSERRARFHEWVVVGVFCALFFFYGLTAFGLVGADEPRYAQIAREMLVHHDGITPTLYGHVWLEKPPLYYWSATVGYRFMGVSDWSARVPVAVIATLMIAAVYMFMRRFRPGTQLLAVLIASSTAGIFSFARAGSTDMPLAASFTIALLAWLAWFQTHEKKWLLTFYFFLAAGMLAKGPVAPLLAGLIVLCFALAIRNFRLVRDTLWIPGIVVFLVTAMPWYVLVQLRNPQFFTEFILRQNIARFGTTLYHHERPFWYFGSVLVAALLPWTVFALAGWLRAVRGWLRATVDGPTAPDDLERFLVIWAAIPVLFFSLSRSKLPGYIIPSLPAWVLLTALYFAYQESNSTVRRALWIGNALLLGCCLGLALLAPWLLLNPHAMPPASILRPPLITAAVLIPILIAFALRRGWHAVSASTLFITVIGVVLLLRTAAPAIDAMQSARPVFLHVANSKVPIAVFRVPRAIQYGLGFYLDREIFSYEAGNIPQQEHLLLMKKGDLKDLLQLLHDHSGLVLPGCGQEPGLALDLSFDSPVFDLYRVSASPACNQPGLRSSGTAIPAPRLEFLRVPSTARHRTHDAKPWMRSACVVPRLCITVAILGEKNCNVASHAS